MNDYVGKPCPYCKSIFLPEDEIVVCRACGVYHHKDCWGKNQGCTTFGCPGVHKADETTPNTFARQISFEQPHAQTSTPSGSFLYCANCGKQHPRTALFCANCGNRLMASAEVPASHPTTTPSDAQQTTYVAPNYPDPQQQTSPNAAPASAYANASDIPIDADVLQLIKTKTEYYVPQFQTIKNKKNKKNKRVWNWSAFLFGPFWMIYRKMYLYGFIHLAILSAALIFLSTYSITGYYLLGPIGNSIYMLTLEKRAGKAKAMAEPQRSQYLKKKSGVNPIAAVLSLS